MKRCQTCGEKIPDAATICPRCQQRQSFMGVSGQPGSSGIDMGAGRGGGIALPLVAGLLVVVLGAGAAGFVFFGQGATPAPLAQASSPSADVAQEPAPSEEPTSPPVVAPPPGLAQDAPAAPPGTCTPETRSARFAAKVQKRLGRPAGFETVRTTTGPVRDDKVTLILTYRASDGTGSPRTGVAIGKVNLSDCGVTIDVMA